MVNVGIVLVFWAFYRLAQFGLPMHWRTRTGQSCGFNLAVTAPRSGALYRRPQAPSLGIFPVRLAALSAFICGVWNRTYLNGFCWREALP
jgi:hypothetical protein